MTYAYPPPTGRGPLPPGPPVAPQAQVAPPGAIPQPAPAAGGGQQPPARRKRLGEVLVEQGLLTVEQVELLLRRQAESGRKRKRLGRLVVEAGFATERQVAQALAAALNLPVVDPEMVRIDSAAARLLPRSVAERHGVLVVARTPNGRGLQLAVVDPTNVVALDDVKLHTGITELHVAVAPEAELRAALGRLWSLRDDEATDSLLKDVSASVEQEAAALSTAALEADDAPIVRLVDRLLGDAVAQRASDVHIEPESADLLVRFRIDGVLRDVLVLPRAVGPTLVSRLKILAGLDIAERRRPQDGRAHILPGSEPIDVRLSVIPALHGEKAVLRLFPRSNNLPPLARIGLSDAQFDLFLSTVRRPQGLVLITGPTGSGKTNTLYSALLAIRDREKNIVTLEDPVEIALSGITQVQINEKAGLTFAAGLRSVLRQDPDVVLVGEIRDQETARLALQASMTGHLVLATLHTNDARSAVGRLVDMGTEPYLVASALTLVVAQRLARCPCPGCAQPDQPTEAMLDLLGLAPADLAGAEPRTGRGCQACGDSGYSGRVGVFELLPITTPLRQALLSKADESVISTIARDSCTGTLRQSAIAAALAGRTTLDEVLRVTVDEGERSTTRCHACQRSMNEEMACCPYCGAMTAGRCIACQNRVEPDWAFCPRCTTPVTRG